MTCISPIGPNGRLRKVILLAIGAGMYAATDSWILVVVADMKSKASGIDVAVAPQKQDAKKRFCQNI